MENLQYLPPYIKMKLLHKIVLTLNTKALVFSLLVFSMHYLFILNIGLDLLN